MEKDSSLSPVELQLAAARREVSTCNKWTAQFGLQLTETQVQTLVQARFDALRDTGRIEFGGGILPKLIYAFCDSPYITQENFEETLCELQEAFYYFKGEARERLSDDELIGFMKDVFDGRAQGSAEYLTGTSLEELCRYARQGFDPSDADELGDLF